MAGRTAAAWETGPGGRKSGKDAGPRDIPRQRPPGADLRVLGTGRALPLRYTGGVDGEEETERCGPDRRGNS